MKHIIGNKYLKQFKFSSSKEAFAFFNKQISSKKLFIDEEFGDSYYCYVCYHSLTMEKQFILAFGSDHVDSDLNFLFWNDCLVLDTGKSVYIIDKNLKVERSFEMTTALVGIYLIDNVSLLLLEEAFLRVLKYQGEIIKTMKFDLIEEFKIENDILYLKTVEGHIIVNLIS